MLYFCRTYELWIILSYHNSSVFALSFNIYRKYLLEMEITMKRFFLIPCIVFLICSCSTTTTNEEKTLTVKIDTVRIYGKAESTDYSGKIRAASDVDIAFKVSGNLMSTPVNEGQYVKKGQLIAEMDPRDYKIQLSATEAEYNQIKAEAERVIELYNRNSVSQSDYDKAVYGLQQITAKYEAHKNALADTRLTAPFDGYIQKYNYSVGETVGAGYPVVSMYSNKNPEVEINIPSSEYNRRNDFDSFTCRIGKEILPLTLVSISPKANLNQLYTARFKVTSNSENALAGMITTVTIKYKLSDDAKLIVPVTAISNTGGDSHVWVYDNGTVTKVSVKPEEVYADGYVSISGNIKAGALVVSGGANNLKEGQKVRPLEPKSNTNIGGLL